MYMDAETTDVLAVRFRSGFEKGRNATGIDRSSKY